MEKYVYSVVDGEGKCDPYVNFADANVAVYLALQGFNIAVLDALTLNRVGTL